MINKLFVYGTLCPGRPNDHWLTRIGGTFEKATIRGRLYPDGWGATLGYPALVIDPDGQEVEGYVFSSPNLDQHWQELDDFEGEGYRRILTQVRLESGDYTAAYLYRLNAAPE